MHRWIGLLVIASCCWGCAATADVAREREILMGLDREWAASVTDIEKFVSYFAPDASMYVPGAPVATGIGPIRETLTPMFSSPGFVLTFAPTKADVGASGDLGYTSGTYESTANGVVDKGKYITVWQKQSGGEWKVKEDIFNSDAGAATAAHAMVEAGSIKWGDAPPSLPPGAKMAVIAGDPSKAGPFTIRAQVPAGYKVPPHWHPGDENLTILSGTVALGMGDSFDESKMQSIGVGGYAALPAQMHHYFLAKTASTFQVHGMGPFAVNYINSADDPSKK